jgi:hypothetical protein
MSRRLRMLCCVAICTVGAALSTPEQAVAQAPFECDDTGAHWCCVERPSCPDTHLYCCYHESTSDPDPVCACSAPE